MARIPPKRPQRGEGRLGRKKCWGLDQLNSVFPVVRVEESIYASVEVADQSSSRRHGVGGEDFAPVNRQVSGVFPGPFRSLDGEYGDRFSVTGPEQLASGGSEKSIDELCDQWRYENPTPEDLEENVAAVQAAIDDMNAGEIGRDAAWVEQELRADLNLPATE